MGAPIEGGGMPIVEADDVYLGGERNEGRGTAGKTRVIAAAERHPSVCHLRRSGPEQHADVVAWRHYRRSRLGTGYAYSEILARLRHRSIVHIAGNNAIWICHDLAPDALGPSFEYDDFVELLPLCLVHIHHNDSRLWFVRRREMLLDKRLPNDREGVAISACVTPILRQPLTELSASFKQPHITHLLCDIFQPCAGAGVQHRAHRDPICIWVTYQRQSC